MNTLPRLIFSALLFAATTTSGYTQALNLKYPEQMVASVDTLVSLSREQRARVTEIVNRAVAEVKNLPAESRLQQQFVITGKMRTEISEQLTAVQKTKYDRTPQLEGGGLSVVAPEEKVRRLDELVKLSAEQKKQALQIFTTELDALLAIPKTERSEKSAAVRKAARDGARAILTPQQQAVYDAAPQSKGGGSTKAPRS